MSQAAVTGAGIKGFHVPSAEGRAVLLWFCTETRDPSLSSERSSLCLSPVLLLFVHRPLTGAVKL